MFNFALFSNFCFACVASNIGFMPCFSFGSRKVSYTLLLRFSKNFVLLVLPHKDRVSQCYSFGSRKVCCMLLVISLYSVNFCVACLASGLCNALTSAPVVYCTLLLLVIYVSCSLSHQHRACAVLFPSAPLKFTPFCFSLFNQLAFVMRALPNKLRFVRWFFSGSPRICTLNFLLCIIQF